MAAPITVLVVRPRAQALRWVAELQARGVPARALPLIEIGPAPDPGRVGAAFEACSEAATSSALAPIVVFVSPNAVAGMFEALRCARVDAEPRSTGISPAWPPGVRACAAGPGTTAALLEAGVPPGLVTAPAPDARQVDSEALWREIGAWTWMGRPVWIARGNGGREWLGERLREAGARVDIVQTYQRREPELADEERAALAAALAHPPAWAWLFSSSEAIGNLVALAPDADWAAARALATHPRIAERARAAGFGLVQDVSPSVEQVVDAVRKLAP